MDKFEDRLRKLQKALNLTQVELADKSNIGRPSMSEYIRGLTIPTITVVEKIAISTGVNLHWLIRGEGPMFINENKAPSIPVENIPKERFKQWLDEFWNHASQDERAWLKIELQKKFPEFAEWLKKIEDVEIEDGHYMKKLA